MHTKTIISAATLVIALGFGGTAFAQAVTLGAQTVTEANMPGVQARCDELQTAGTAPATDSENSDDATAAADASATAGSTTEGTTEQGTEEGTAGLIELDTITLEQCMEAGLIK